MKYREPKAPENINVTPVHPLRELLVLLAGALVIVVLLSLVLGFAGGYLAKQLPYSTELALMGEDRREDDRAPQGLRQYIEQLTARLTPHLNLPPEMDVSITIHGDDTVNAYATLGGRMHLYRGLLEKLPNENALAMLIAHEAAHLAHRHPMESLGENAAVQLGLALLGSSDLGILDSAGGWAALGYSRAMESEADASARQALLNTYGHLGGAAELFEVLLAEYADNGEGRPIALFSTHPDLRQRLEHLQTEHSQAITPLPEEFPAWMRTLHKAWDAAAS